MRNHRSEDASFMRAFLASEAASGMLLMLCALLALVVANSPLAPGYFALLDRQLGMLSVLHWINDALMAGFFLLVGLEIKRELLVGQLRTWSRRALPGIAAAGGMIAPALVYLAFNLNDDGAPRGWAIPAATDIAFALGVLALLGPRVPVSLKLFLTALAVLDDLGAVIIIALFYTAQLHPLALLGAGAAITLLIALNRFGVRHTGPYLAIGIALWIFVHQSGVHATLAGVALALCIPLRGEHAPLPRLERALHPWIGFFVVPLFGFANAGVALRGMSFADLGDTVPLGVALGLFFGKQIGVFGAAWLAIRAGIATLPEAASWRQLYGTAVLCGIGFTMSLFIGALAFDAAELQEQTKIGVLLGSLASAVAGAALLRSRPHAAAILPGT